MVLVSDLEKEAEGAKWTPTEISSADFPKSPELQAYKAGRGPRMRGDAGVQVGVNEALLGLRRVRLTVRLTVVSMGWELL